MQYVGHETRLISNHRPETKAASDIIEDGKVRVTQDEFHDPSLTSCTYAYIKSYKPNQTYGMQKLFCSMMV